MKKKLRDALRTFFIIFMYSFFISYGSTLSPEEQGREEIIFFNLLYWGIIRSEAIIRYFDYSITQQESKYCCDLNILSRMRNPSTRCDSLNIQQYKEKNSEYIDFLTSTDTAFDTYKILVNNFYHDLSEEYKKKMENVKNEIAISIIKEIAHLYSFIEKLKKIYDVEIEDSEIQKKGLQEIFDKASTLFGAYHNYKNTFLYFDNLFIKQAKNIHLISNLFYSYYKEFWITIEKYRIKKLIDLYHEEMNKYLLKNGTKTIPGINRSKEGSFFNGPALPTTIILEYPL